MVYCNCEEAVSLTLLIPLQGHPYRNVLDLRHGASTSLIELEFASHTGQDSDTDPAVPAGLPFYILKAQLRELELVFLNRFLQVCLSQCLAPGKAPPPCPQCIKPSSKQST